MNPSCFFLKGLGWWKHLRGKLYLWGLWWCLCTRDVPVKMGCEGSCYRQTNRRASLQAPAETLPQHTLRQILTHCGLRSSASEVLQIYFIQLLIGIWMLESVEAAHVFVTCCFPLHLWHCRSPGEVKRPRRMRKTMAECSALGRHRPGLWWTPPGCNLAVKAATDFTCFGFWGSACSPCGQADRLLQGEFSAAC